MYVRRNFLAIQNSRVCFYILPTQNVGFYVVCLHYILCTRYVTKVWQDVSSTIERQKRIIVGLYVCFVGSLSYK
jgi:hypothetical protein